jgi:nucleotidyltransferase substrate binding protein (TIGR01987 family)
MKVEFLRKDFARALGQLQSALQVPATSDLLKAGCIQYFEFCFELAWKTIKAVGSEQGSECLSPKACLRLAFQQGWIDSEEVWLDMLLARNRLSHTYDVESALVVYGRLPAYFTAMEASGERISTIP